MPPLQLAWSATVARVHDAPILEGDKPEVEMQHDAARVGHATPRGSRRPLRGPDDGEGEGLDAEEKEEEEEGGVVAQREVVAQASVMRRMAALWPEAACRRWPRKASCAAAGGNAR